MSVSLDKIFSKSSATRRCVAGAPPHEGTFYYTVKCKNKHIREKKHYRVVMQKDDE